MKETRKKSSKPVAATKTTLTISMAVKHRPRVIDDVVGQEAIVTKFKGMLKTNSFPSCILLFGPSGSGKTTMGRIIGRYLNCDTMSACGECPSCLCGDSHPDIVERNMADTRGIDDIRALDVASRLMPRYRKRVFLLDECFAAGTLVSTTRGNRPIETVQVGESVFNRDGVGTVVNVFRNRVALERVVRVDLSDGTFLTCSEDHVFFTERGEVKAKELAFDTLEILDDDKFGRFSSEPPRGTRSEPVAVDDVRWYQPDNGALFTGSVGERERERGFVEFYDLEVDGHPSYYAHGVLVHNCHQLTPQASNSILKSLEEPSENTIWVLATTNPEKLLNTIRGRCHPFEMRRLGERDIVRQLLKIGRLEGQDFKQIDGGIDILKLIAGLCNGQMRDSIQMLESAIYALRSGETLTQKDMMTKFASTAEADLDKEAAVVLVELLRKNVKGVLHHALAGNGRQLMLKTRWLVQGVVQDYVDRAPFLSYGHRFLVVQLKKREIEVDDGVIRLLLKLQNELVQAEQLMNQGVNEEVAYLNALGRFL